MSRRKFRTFDDARIEYYKKHPKELKTYLEIALEEYQADNNEKAFLSAMAIVAKVHGGFSKLAKNTGLNRENLYRALSENSDPRFSTVIQVLNTLGVNLKIA